MGIIVVALLYSFGSFWFYIYSSFVCLFNDFKVTIFFAYNIKGFYVDFLTAIMMMIMAHAHIFCI